AARCYLGAAVRRRDNLVLRPDTLVHRVRIQNRRVVGLDVETGGRIEFVPAAKVVLSAGAIATPGILLRSGVGPRPALERLGVPPISILPAGGAPLLRPPRAALMPPPPPGAGRLPRP